jgi:hypothetical protein
MRQQRKTNHFRAPEKVSHKRCTKCGEVKPLTSFSVSNHGKPRSWCKSCYAANTRAWNKRNLERARENKRCWLQTERGKASNRASYRHYRERNLEKVRQYRRRWVQTEKGRTSCQRARLKWLARHPDAIFTGLVSLDAPYGSKGTLIDCIADNSAVNPLERLIQNEAVIEVAKRVVSERGCSWDTAIAIVEAHA